MKPQGGDKIPASYFLRTLYLLLLFSIATIIWIQFYASSESLTNWKMTFNSRVSLYNLTFHNTLIVDRFSADDFLKFANITKPSSRMSLYEKIIVSEGHYKQAIRDRPKDVNGNGTDWYAAEMMERIFPPSFNCPHFVERVGSPAQAGEWICGLDLYETEPKPEECVIYMIKDEETLEDWHVLELLASRTKCHILNFYLNNNIYTTVQANMSSTSTRVQNFENTGIGVTENNKMKTLRNLMKTNGHAWIDILFLDIKGREFLVLEQIITNFYDICPVGQLHVNLHLAPSREENRAYLDTFQNFTVWFESLEKKGFRPFHAESNLIGHDEKAAVVEYSFINIRGKHLLLTGKNSEISR